MSWHRQSQAIPTLSLQQALTKSGLGHLYQKDVISSLAVQTFVLSLVLPNAQLSGTYEVNLGGISGSLLFGWLISRFGRITLLRQILFMQIVVSLLLAAVGFWHPALYPLFQIYLALYAGFFMIALIYIIEISSDNL